MFDEPSSYLDIKQRMIAAQAIRSLSTADNYVMVIEHDLAVLDYMSDTICMLYGTPSAYGVVSAPLGVREGINVFLSGFLPTENMRFRPEALTFKLGEGAHAVLPLTEDEEKQRVTVTYPRLTKTLGHFALTIEPGSFQSSEIIVLMAQNGCGKTTFIRLLAGLLPTDDPGVVLPQLNVSYKPQMLQAKFQGTVRELLHTRVPAAFNDSLFQADVVRPLKVTALLDQPVQQLSGGQLQTVAIVMALGKPADVYLLDEPSAYLDVEQRVMAAKVIKRFIMHSRKTAFIVEHDFIMSLYVASRILVFTGEPGVACTALAPESVLTGMNRFLCELGVTFRRDPTNHRPRINKLDSVKDREQKLAGTYFYMDTNEETEDGKTKQKV